MASFTESVLAANKDAWDSLLDNEFTARAADATLPLECFRFYLEQDLMYLRTYARVLGRGAARSVTDAELDHFADALQQIVKVEIGHNQQLLDDTVAAGATSRGGAAEASPACLAYMSYLTATAADGDVLEILTATLPCAWSYREIALRHPNPEPHAIYHDWLKLFASDDYDAFLQDRLARIDAFAQHVSDTDLERLQWHFKTATRFERAFWDTALQLQHWPDSEHR